MSLITSLKLIEFRPETAQGRIFVRRRKLAEKIDQQINLADDAAFIATKIVTVTDENGNQHRREVAKRIKRWWIVNADDTVQLTVRYAVRRRQRIDGQRLAERADYHGWTDFLVLDHLHPQPPAIDVPAVPTAMARPPLQLDKAFGLTGPLPCSSQAAKTPPAHAASGAKLPRGAEAGPSSRQRRRAWAAPSRSRRARQSGRDSPSEPPERPVSGATAKRACVMSMPPLTPGLVKAG